MAMTGLAPQRVLRRPRLRLRGGLVALVLAVSALSLGTGAAGVSLPGVLADLLSGAGIAPRDRVVLLDVRLPRLAMGLAVGAALAVAGALMQGLFRNPLADPGIVGTGAGAGLGAVAAIMLSSLLPAGLAMALGSWLVPAAAFAGAWGAALILYRIASQGGRTSVATLLLAGIALAALAGALTGVLVAMADDRQLRDLTFWGLGSLGGASWDRLGDAALAGASVALAGGIGFIGIVVPHLMRLLAAGPDHRRLLVDAALLGAALLVGADLIARQVVAPAELPIGIVTAVLGSPVFLWILLRQRSLPGM